MSRRLRISHVIVQPVFAWDDGEELSPGPQAAPITVPLSGLDGLAERFRAELSRLESQPTEAPA